MSRARSRIRLVGVVFLIVAVCGLGAWWYVRRLPSSAHAKMAPPKPEPLHELRPPSDQHGDYSQYMPDHSQEIHDPCSEQGEEAATQRYDLWDGYRFQIVGKRTEQDSMNCKGVLIDPAGHAIWETGAVAAVSVENVTGTDINGDGKPELVLTLNHGFPRADIDSVLFLSVSPHPDVLAEVGAVGVSFGKDDSGGTIFKTMEMFFGIADLQGVETPAAWQVYRLRGKVLQDVTPDYCHELIREMEPGNDAIARYLHPERFSQKPGTGYNASSSGVVALLMQSIYCHDQKMEEQIAETMLPPDDRQRLREEVHHRLRQ